MAKDALQGEDITAIHHVVAGEGVAEDVGLLLRGLKVGSLIGRPEGITAGLEESPWCRIGKGCYLAQYIIGYRHCPTLPGFRKKSRGRSPISHKHITLGNKKPAQLFAPPYIN